MGVVEITQKQYTLVKRVNPSFDTSASHATHAVDCVYWSDIRGDAMTYNWPTEASVDPKSFVGILYERTGMKFDLPTEAQWEYACRAGTTTRYSYGNTENGDYMWWENNAYYRPEKVGMKLPNDWGLYDMHGNASEWCLDWYGVLSGEEVVDPKGAILNKDKYRVCRGGDISGQSIANHSAKQYCSSSYRGLRGYNSDVWPTRHYGGFRLARTLHKKYTDVFKGVVK
jgi:formylglycine-generating enzyme required for sulfatase activity